MIILTINAGIFIASVSKAKDTVVDLGTYKPAREGYTFKGWYSDSELKTKLTSYGSELLP